MSAERIDVDAVLEAAMIDLVLARKVEVAGMVVEARYAFADLARHADNAATALSNLIAAGRVDEGYSQYVTDLTASLSRCGGGK